MNRVWRVPVLLSALTIGGLVVALVFDDMVASVIGCIGIAAPLVVMLRCFGRSG